MTEYKNQGGAGNTAERVILGNPCCFISLWKKVNCLKWSFEVTSGRLLGKRLPLFYGIYAIYM